MSRKDGDLISINMHRWAGQWALLKQQTSISVYRLMTKEKNFHFPFAENKRKFAVSVSVCNKQTEVAVFC
jgi:hypothetical protein